MNLTTYNRLGLYANNSGLDLQQTQDTYNECIMKSTKETLMNRRF